MTNTADNTNRPGDPFDERQHMHLARQLPTACWALKLYADDIAAAYNGHDNQERAALAHAARAAANTASELLARMAAVSRDQFPDAAWLKRYNAPQPPDLHKKKQSNKRRRK